MESSRLALELNFTQGLVLREGSDEVADVSDIVY